MSSDTVAIRLSAEGQQQFAQALGSATDSIAGLGAAGAAAGMLLGQAFLSIVGKTTQALDELMRSGMRASEVYERNTIGLAALITSFSTVSDAQGRVLEGREKLNTAMVLSDQIMGRLIATSFQTGVAVEELQKGFNTLYGGGAMAGASVDQLLKLSQQLANMARTTNTSFDSIVHQMALVEGGVVHLHGSVGVLLRSLGIDSNLAQQWKDQGTLVENLIKRFEAFSMIGDRVAGSMTGLRTNMETIETLFSRAFTASIFEEVKRDLDDLEKQLVTVGEKAVTLNPQIEGTLRTLGITIAGVTRLTMDEVGKILSVGSGAVGSAGLSVSEFFATAAMVVLAKLGALKTSVEQTFVYLDAWMRTLLSGFVLTAAGVIGTLSDVPVIGEKFKGMADYLRTVGGELAADGVLADGFGARMAKIAENNAESLKPMMTQLNLIRTGMLNVAEDVDAKLVNRPGPNKALDDALKKLTEFRDRLKEQVSSAGLEGYEKAISDVNTKYDLLLQKLEKLNTFKNNSVMQQIAKEAKDIIEGGRSADLGKVQLDYYAKAEAAAKKYGDAVSKINSMVKDDAVSKIVAERDARLHAIDEELAAAYKQAGLETTDYIKMEADRTAATQAALEARRAVTEKAARQITMLTAAQAGDWRALWAAVDEDGRAAFESLQERAAKMATIVLKNGKTASDGLAAAAWQVLSEIPTTAQMVATAALETWHAIGKGFEDSVYSVISGKVSSLKDVLTGLWDDILRSFSKLIRQMVEQLLLGDAAAARTGLLGGLLFGGGTAGAATGSGAGNPENTDYAAYGTDMGGGGVLRSFGSSGLPGWVSYLGAGATGLGIGSMIGGGGTGNMVGGAAGAILGAYIGSALPIVGTLVGAIVGAIIGGIFNKSTEMSNSANGGEVLGFATPTTGMGSSGLSAIESQQTWMADLFRKGDKSKAQDWMTAYRASLNEMLGASWFKLSAGSDQDLGNLNKWFTGTFLPKAAMSAAFGQVGYLPSGNRNAAGGAAGFDWYTGSGAMNKDGAWVRQQLYDPNAPIPAMLTGLGFTSAKIEEIATRLSGSTDMDKFKTYLQGLVEVVTGFRDLSTKLGTGMLAEVGWREGNSPLDQLLQANKDVVDQFQGLDLLTGDEQVTRAKELIQLASDRYEAEVAYLQKVKAAFEQVKGAIDTLSQSTQDWLDKKNADWLLNDARGNALSARAAFDAQQDPEKAAAEAGKAVQAVQGVLSALKAMWDQAARLKEQFVDLAARFSAPWAALEDTGSFSRVTGDQAKLLEQIRAANRLEGQERLDALEKVRTTAEDVYNRQIALMRTLDGLITEITNAAVAAQAKATDFLLGKNADWLLNDKRNQATFARGKFDSLVGTDPVAAAQWAKDGIAAASQVIDALIAQFQRASALRDKFASLAAKFADPLGDGASDYQKLLTDQRQLALDIAAANKLDGQARLDALEKVGATAEEVYSRQVALIRSLGDALAQVVTASTAAITKAADFLAGKDADWQLSDKRNQALYARGQYDAFVKSDPALAAQWAQIAISTASEVIDSLIGRYNQLAALKPEIDALVASFGDPLSGVNPLTGLAGYLAQALSLQTEIGRVAKLSGQAQIDQIQKVQASATEMYRAQQQLLQSIEDQARSLREGIADTRWNLDYGDMNPQQQAGALQDRVKRLMQQLKDSTDPTEIGNLQNQIRTLVTQYYGLFSADDPNRQAAHQWVDTILDTLESTGQAALDGIKTQVLSWSHIIEQGLQGVSTSISTSMDALRAEIDRWEKWLEELRASAKTGIGAAIDEIVRLSQAIGGTGGLGASVTALGSQMDALRAEVDKWNKWIGELQASAKTGIGAAIDEIVRLSQEIGGEHGLTATVTALDAQMAALEAEAARWLDWLKTLRADIDTKLGGVADALDAANAALKEQVDRATSLFTDVNGSLAPTSSAVDGATQSVSEFDTSVSAARVSVAAMGDGAAAAASTTQSLAQAALDATAALNGFVAALGTGMENVAGAVTDGLKRNPTAALRWTGV